jgi:glycerophosphoryl diester phosphodiesterase
MKPELIAHRGHPVLYPENTLPGIESAVSAGARFVEIDVQISADAVPILLHDRDLARIAGLHGLVGETDYATISGLAAAFPERFGDRFRDIRIPTLREFCASLARWPQVSAFVEIKRGCLERFGTGVAVRRILEVLLAVRSQCVIISFEYDALVEVRSAGWSAIGWVLREWSAQAQATAVRLCPDYLFCRRDRLPARREELWEGPWRWVVYTVDEPHEALAWASRGMDMVETDRIGDMLGSPHFTQRDAG